MQAQRTHTLTTADGATIGGTVHGQGPPLVFVHGIIGDGDLDWQALLPHLTDRFTCHLPSTRGRGLSGDHPDHTRGRLVDDIIAYVDSIGETAALVGFSSGGAMSLSAAAQSETVTAVAVHEPALTALLDSQQQATFGETVARVGEHVAAGRLASAAHTFAGYVCNDTEIAVLEQAGYLEAAGRYTPVLVNDVQQLRRSDGPTADDPEVLGRIAAPLLVLHGPETATPWFTGCVHHLADHVPDARIREIPDAGHYAPVTHPEALAEALVAFLEPAQQPV